MTLAVLALLAQAPPPLAAVEAHLPSGSDPRLMERAAGLITLRRGQPWSRRAVQRSLENLYATGRFSDLVAVLEEGPAGPKLVFELTPRPVVSQVYAEGRSALTLPELLAAARLEVGAEYWPERALAAARAVAAAYRRRGYQGVAVEARVDEAEGGVAVGFLVTEGEPTRLSALTLAGDPGLPLPRLVEALGIAPPDVLDEARLEAGAEALRRLFRAQRFYRAQVDAPQVQPGGRVVVPLSAGPRYEVTFSGNHHVSARALAATLAYDGEERLDSALAARLAARLARFYRFRGFHEARVQAREVPGPGPGRATLVFGVEEGSPLRVTAVDFEGNRAIGDGELLGVLRDMMVASAPPATLQVRSVSDPVDLEGRSLARVDDPQLPSPPPETVLDEQAWAEAARAMGALYRSRGYLKATVRLLPVELSRGEAQARFVVDEGPRAEFRKVEARGLPAGFRALVLGDPSRPGSTFSADALDDLRGALVRELGREGYLFAAVTASFTLDPGGRFADCALVVEPGPQVKVRAVLPVGNQRTRDEVVLGQAAMTEGQPLDADSLARTQGNLMGLGVFRSVEVELLSPERPEPLKTVLLKVHERPRVSGEFGLGYFVADGPRIVFDLDAPNLGGRAVNLNFHGQLNWFALSVPAVFGQVDVSGLAAWEQLGGRGNLSVGSRSLLPANIGLRFDVVGERVFRPGFRFSRIAGVPTVDWSLPFELPFLPWARPKFSLALQYQVEWTRVEHTGSALETVLPTSLADQERLRFNFGEFALQTVRLSPTLDLRDNALNPHRGFLLQATAEVTGKLYAADETGHPVTVNFLKTSGLLSVYVPLGKVVVLALSARAGRIFPLEASSSTPPVNRFFLGGATSMRGFNEDQLIAEDLRTQYRQEVRDCRILAVKEGCTSPAQAVLAGQQVPSQGGELFGLAKAEVRFPVFGLFDLGPFFEVGNLWLVAPANFGPFRTVAGLGVRYQTPIGPLALDLGVNLAPDVVINEPTFVVHFNIGVF